jgi:hypothetical protein
VGLLNGEGVRSCEDVEVDKLALSSRFVPSEAVLCARTGEVPIYLLSFNPSECCTAVCSVVMCGPVTHESVLLRRR